MAQVAERAGRGVELGRVVAKAAGQAAGESGGALRLIGLAKAPFAKLRGVDPNGLM
ncbi:MAG: hypothetical protein HY901_14225 [Deltaproteobacteria bacterium]|nr:hypothetical protein [Deltaproteobacteria bacterium]